MSSVYVPMLKVVFVIFLSYTVGIDYINVYSIVMVLTPIFSYVNLCIVESLFRCIMKY